MLPRNQSRHEFVTCNPSETRDNVLVGSKGGPSASKALFCCPSAVSE